MTEPHRIRLRRDAAILELAPAAGGAITRYARDDGGGPVDLLRPASPEAVEERVPTRMACFPLVPFSNRVGYGRFTFRGRSIELPANFPPEPHAIHGHGWSAPWEVLDRTEDSATLEYRHHADAWPFPYRVRQRFQLAPDHLAVSMEVRNEGDESMPVGFGWHPFFVRTPETRVTATVDRVWLAGDDALPERLIPVPEGWGLADGLKPDGLSLDNNFLGWDGHARIDWPEREAGLELEVEGPFGVLVLYTPAGEDFFCVEPASNSIDAFNLAAGGREDTGMLVLDPGRSVSGSMRLRPVQDA